MSQRELDLLKILAPVLDGKRTQAEAECVPTRTAGDACEALAEGVCSALRMDRSLASRWGSAMSQANADRNLLLGILAYQNAFVTRDALVAAMQAWLYAKDQPLADLLCRQGALDTPRRQLLEALVAQHLGQHGGDPQQSLHAVRAAGAVRDDLAKILDAELQASLLHLSGTPSDDDLVNTRLSAGASTSAGARFIRLRPHAKGGLGEVFVALDSELNREVALKEIQDRHADQPESRARFVLEAEITGRLEHPGIVPVYGLGTYADGRPFYAMRFVRGDSLMEAIERFHGRSHLPGGTSPGPARQAGPTCHSLAFRQLLRRLIDVCNALQYAHDRGVLHRDLKPGNIMLGKYGETLIVDWGLAKPVGQRLAKPSRDPGSSTLTHEAPLVPATGSGSAETVAGSVFGTPAYMSPEQAAGRLDLFGPASDVYSLGATLYCLLTGQPPFQGDPVAVLKRVQVGDLPPPRRVQPGVAPALEAICLKAMALRPADRYAAPKHLADDLEQWLADEPVGAWPEPWTVKTGRWMRRHKPLVSAAAAAMIVLLLAGTAGLLWYRVEQDRRQAEAERKQALAEAAIHEALDQASQRRVELHAILQQPGGVFGLLNDPPGWQTRIERARSALARARVLLDGAGDGLDPALAATAAQVEQELEKDDADRLLAVRLEKIRMDSSDTVDGKFAYAGAARDYPAAFAEAGWAVLTEKPAVVAARLAGAPTHEALVAALDDWALVAFLLRNNDLCGRLLKISRLAAPDPAWGDRLRQVDIWQDRQRMAALVKQAPVARLSPPLLNLIGAFLAENDLGEEGWYRQAQAQYPADFWLNYGLGTVLLKAKPVEAAGFLRVALTVRPRSSVAYNNLGNALRAQKQWPEAIKAYDKAIAIDPKYATPYLNLGVTLAAQKQWPEAIKAYKEVIAIDPKHAQAYNNLGLTLAAQKQWAEAIKAYDKAIDCKSKYAKAYTNLGVALHAQKQWAEAIVAYNKAIDCDPKDALAYNNLGLTLAAQKQWPEAIKAFGKAIAIDPKDALAYYNLGLAYNNLGIALYEQKQWAEAIKAFENAIECNPKHAQAYNNLGLTLAAQKQWAEAITAFDKAIAIDPKDALAYYNLGIALSAQKQWAEAITAYHKAIAIDPDFALAYYNLGLTFARQKQWPEAIKAFDKAIECNPKHAQAYNNLGLTFAERKQWAEAIKAFDKAIAIDPNFAQAHGNLGLALLQQGAFAEAAKANQQALDLLPPTDPWRDRVERQLKESQALLALDQRLPAVLDGTDAAPPAVLLQLAGMCHKYKHHHASAARLYQQAFQAQPALADDAATPHRYHAACAAALAGTGHDASGAKLAPADQAQLRQQARIWLRADLDQGAKGLKSAPATAVLQTVDRLAHWQGDPALADVREAKALAGLPEEEAKTWQKLWADVAALLKEARGRFTETRIEGSLTATEKSHAIETKLQAGRTYVFDLESTALDAFLKLHGPDGKLLAENDDIVPGVNLNSRIIFTAPADGVYRIVATSFQQAGVGAYLLRMRAFQEAQERAPAP
jgi:tetratricopeptide (TPR) repeat protein/serine/threonine protein kinase